MNWKLLKDLKSILAFAFALLFEIIGIVLAFKSNDNDAWVVFVVFGILLTSYGVNRATRLWKKSE